MKKLPYILIDLPATIVTNRQMLMGILRYAHLHGPWLTQIIGYDAHLSAKNALNSRQYDGAIIDVENSAIARQILRLDIPVVQSISDIATPPPVAAGIAMPEELSILGVDNDPVFCESTTPPASSIQMNTEECGFNAARALDRMMNGQTGGGPIVYGYAGVEERMSTNVSCYKDPLVAAAVRTLTDRIACGKQPSISAGELAQVLKTSLRILEVRFKSETGRTLHEEITRLRFEQAQNPLKRTPLSVGEIAHRCGFATASHFSVMFKRTFGLAPLAYRKA